MNFDKYKFEVMLIVIVVVLLIFWLIINYFDNKRNNTQFAPINTNAVNTNNANTYNVETFANSTNNSSVSLPLSIAAISNDSYTLLFLLLTRARTKRTITLYK